MAVFDEKHVTLRDGSAIVLRSPTEDDAEALRGYLDTARRETEMIMFGPDDTLPTLEEERQFIRARVDDDGGVPIMAVADGRPIGMSSVSRNKFVRQRHIATLGISVLQAWHGRGVGRALIDELIAWAKQHDELEQIVLTVFADNERGLRLYERCGFVRGGLHRKGVKRGPGRYADVVSMALDLTPAAGG